MAVRFEWSAHSAPIKLTESAADGELPFLEMRILGLGEW